MSFKAARGITCCLLQQNNLHQEIDKYDSLVVLVVKILPGNPLGPGGPGGPGGPVGPGGPEAKLDNLIAVLRAETWEKRLYTLLVQKLLSNVGNGVLEANIRITKLI